MKQSQDKFYTDPDVAQHCINTIDEQFDLWLEPSAGSGSFLHQLPHPRLGLDINPDADDILEQNFLTWKPDAECDICVIGNPPFGKNSAQAVRFFLHATQFAKMIAFIVPRTWSRVSFQNRLPLAWSCVYEELLEDRIFRMQSRTGSRSFSYPCVWQIWVPQLPPRTKCSLPMNHPDWKWTTRDEANWVLRRTGGSAGMMTQDFSCADEGNYFILCDDTVAQKLRSLQSAMRAVANESSYPNLPKTEIVQIYSNN